MRLFLLPSVFKGGSSGFMVDHWAGRDEKDDGYGRSDRKKWVKMSWSEDFQTSVSDNLLTVNF